MSLLHGENYLTTHISEPMPGIEVRARTLAERTLAGKMIGGKPIVIVGQEPRKSQKKDRGTWSKSMIYRGPETPSTGAQ